MAQILCADVRLQQLGALAGIWDPLALVSSRAAGLERNTRKTSQRLYLVSNGMRGFSVGCHTKNQTQTLYIPKWHHSSAKPQIYFLSLQIVLFSLLPGFKYLLGKEKKKFSKFLSVVLAVFSPPGPVCFGLHDWLYFECRLYSL